jgi:hypothetical protein
VNPDQLRAAILQAARARLATEMDNPANTGSVPDATTEQLVRRLTVDIAQVGLRAFCRHVQASPQPALWRPGRLPIRCAACTKYADVDEPAPVGRVCDACRQPAGDLAARLIQLPPLAERYVIVMVAGLCAGCSTRPAGDD